MSKYIDADLLRKEIERRITDNTFGAKLELIDILAWLDTLSEEPDKSLEEEIDRFEDWMETYNQSDYPTSFTTRDIARHFAEWQKQQMLKEAVEGEAEELYNDGESQCVVSVGTYFEPGDKVYVLKAEEE